MIEFDVLGPLRVRSEAGEITVAGVRRRALLIRLLMSANHAVQTARLAEDLWEGEPPPGAVSTLASHISLLRRVLGTERIRGGAGGYSLTVGATELDSTLFEAEARQAREALGRGDAHGAVERAVVALGRWRGPALDDVAGVAWARPDSVRLEELRLGATEVLLDARLALGENDEVTAAAEAAVARFPLRERFWGQLMTALYRSGRQADALRAYQRLRTTLDEELGLEPSESVAGLERAIVLHSPELDQALVHRGASGSGPSTASDGYPIPLPPALISTPPIRCVGREQELGLLVDLWRESASGARRTTFVGGEPGIGKTRLVREFGRRVHAEGAAVLYGRCDEDLGVSYQPFAEALRHYFATSGADLGDGHPDLARILPELGLRISPAALSGVDPGIERWRLFEDVATWLSSASTRHPTVLILEDLHWAAVPSLLLVRHLVRHTHPAALHIVGTFRDAELERGHPLESLLADLRPEDDATRISLTGLDEEGVVAYLEATTGVELDARGRSFATSLYQEASGNPLFIGEVLRHLIETGEVNDTEGKWTFGAGLPSFAIPTTVRDVIARRIARLPSSAQLVLSVAACSGQEFDLGVIEDVVDGGDWVLQDLDRAVGARIVDELPGYGHYTFSHALIRRTLYQQLSSTRRRRIHGQLGAAIEARYSDDLAPFFPNLCLHFAEAPEPESRAKAAGYALAAAQRSLGQLAAEEAVSQVTTGLNLLAHESRPHRALRADLQLARAQALLFSGDIAGSKAAAAAGAEEARAIGSASRLVAAAAARGWHAAPGDADPMVPALCLEALEMAGSTGPEIRARALAALALYMAVNDGEVVEADPLAAESVELASALNDPPLLWQALYGRSHTLWPSELIGQRLAIVDEMVGLAERIEEVEPRHQSLFLRGVVRLESADRRGFEADLADVEREAADYRAYWVPSAVATLWRVLQCLLDGRIGDAEARVIAGLRLAPPSDLIFRTAFAAQLFAIRREQGRLGELIPAFQSGAGGQLLPAVQAGMAVAHAESGDMDRARDYLTGLAASNFSALRRDSTWTIQLADVADVVDLVGAREHAAHVYGLLEPRRGQLVVASLGCFCAGAVDRYLGMMAGLLGELDTARGHFDEALRLEAGIAADPLVARTEISYARTLVDLGPDRDRAFADQLIDQSLTTSRRLGLPALERAAISLRSSGSVGTELA